MVHGQLLVKLILWKLEVKIQLVSVMLFIMVDNGQTMSTAINLLILTMLKTTGMSM
eukprot:jgi/Orpsp1_1/1178706/evm.model.c7180000066429.1